MSLHWYHSSINSHAGHSPKGCLPANEDGPRNVIELNTAAMFLEEFHAWNEHHDHNRPSLSDEGAESGARDDCIKPMSPSYSYLWYGVSPGPDFEQLYISSTSLRPVAVPIEETSPQIRHQPPLWLPIPELDQHCASPNQPAWSGPPFLGPLEVR